MKTAIILAALLASGSAMGQAALSGDASNYSPGPRNVDPGPWRPDPVVQNHYDVIPQAWWTDQGNPEIACYHYDNGPYRDRLIDWCLAKVRGAK